jgi:hypothetical protein
VTKRDRFILAGVAALGVVAAFWILVLNPKLGELSDAKEQLAGAQSTLDEAKATATQYAQARLEFPDAYAEITRIGKAVPPHTDQTSLVYQLEQAADRADVKFTNLTLDSGEGGAAAAAPAPAPAAPPAGSEGGATGATGATGSTGATGAPAAATAAPAEAVTPTPTEELLGSVPADAVATAAVPTGSTTGAASLRVMHFTLDFKGSFFRLEDFLREIKRMTWSRNKELSISGRLVSVDAIEFDSTGKHVKINATTYLLPSTQGLFAGATPVGPAGVGQPGAQAASGTAAPTAPPAATVRVR